MDITDLSSLRVVDLKKELQNRGLSTAGVKAELLRRLHAAINEDDSHKNGQNQSAPETSNQDAQIAPTALPTEQSSGVLENTSTTLGNINQTGDNHFESDVPPGAKNEYNFQEPPVRDHPVDHISTKDKVIQIPPENSHNMDEDKMVSSRLQEENPVQEETLQYDSARAEKNNTVQNTNPKNLSSETVDDTKIADENENSSLNSSSNSNADNQSLEREMLLRRILEKSRQESTSIPQPASGSEPKNARESNSNAERMAEELLASLGDSIPVRSGSPSNTRDSERRDRSRQNDSYNGTEGRASEGDESMDQSNSQLGPRKRSRSRGRDRDQDRKRPDKSRDKSRRGDRDGYRERPRERDRERDRYQDKYRHRSRERSKASEDKYRESKRRSRSRSQGRRRRSRSYNRTGSKSRDRGRDRDSKRDRDRSQKEVVPLHLRERKLNLWDMAPSGFENMSALDAKKSGLFPPPGQALGSRNVASFNPAVLQEQKMRDQAMKEGRELDMKSSLLSRQMKRIYVGNIPYGVNEDSIASFFSKLMVDQGYVPESEFPVVGVQINHAKNYAFVEFKTSEQATMAMSLDGAPFQSQNLKIRRPKDYLPPAGQAPDPVPASIFNNTGSVRNNSFGIPTMVSESPYKIYIGNLPNYLNDDQVIELLRTFGELKSFILVKDTMTGNSKGFAFCEYADPNITDIACTGLNNMELGDRRIIVQRASVGARTAQMPGQLMSMQQHGVMSINMPESLLQPALSGESVEATTVLQLLNMVTEEELGDDEEYNDILDDVADECSKFGKVESVKIPRPSGGQPVPGLGKIFVKFSNTNESTSALRALAGRKFADRTVLASYLSEQDFYSENF